ncbi:MAG: hypothetical protein WC399_00615 [Bacilli bacterium]|jgi:uncharacterized protein
MLKFVARSILAVATLVMLIIFGVRSCASHEYPRPSEAFYVSDYADMLGPSVENFLISESEYLFESTKDVPDVGGIQIVYTTFLLESEAELGAYDKVDLFNEWKIGKNEMGILVIMFFVPLETVDETEYYSLTDIQVANGDVMAEYMGTISLEIIVKDTFEHYLPTGTPTYPYDYDLALGVATSMNALLNIAYGDVYDDPDNVVSQDNFVYWYEEEYLPTADVSSPKDTTNSMNVFLYFFSAFGSVTDKLLFGAFALAFALAGAMTVKGAGGTSSGAGLFWHRR